MTQEHPITPPPELVKQWEGTAYNAATIPYTHPITPPPELVEQWYETADNSSKDVIQEVATQAARWGADQELEACCVWLRGNDPYEHDYHQMLRAVRRPKPPSLKELALAELELLRGDANAHGLGFDAPAIRRALEQLNV